MPNSVSQIDPENQVPEPLQPGLESNIPPQEQCAPAYESKNPGVNCDLDAGSKKTGCREHRSTSRALTPPSSR